jgi:hypothetical protein
MPMTRINTTCEGSGDRIICGVGGIVAVPRVTSLYSKIHLRETACELDKKHIGPEFGDFYRIRCEPFKQLPRGERMVKRVTDNWTCKADGIWIFCDGDSSKERLKASKLILNVTRQKTVFYE